MMVMVPAKAIVSANSSKLVWRGRLSRPLWAKTSMDRIRLELFISEDLYWIASNGPPCWQTAANQSDARDDCHNQE